MASAKPAASFSDHEGLQQRNEDRKNDHTNYAQYDSPTPCARCVGCGALGFDHGRDIYAHLSPAAWLSVLSAAGLSQPMTVSGKAASAPSTAVSSQPVVVSGPFAVSVSEFAAVKNGAYGV